MQISLGLGGRNRKNGNAELKSRAVNEIKMYWQKWQIFIKSGKSDLPEKEERDGVTRSGIDAIIGGSHGAAVRILSERNGRC